MGDTSILVDVKKMLGIMPDDTDFDTELILHINSVLNILSQLGVGPDQAYSIGSDEETWNDFLTDIPNLNLVKSYIYLKVKLVFDPPATGVLHEAMERQIQEFEWRLNVMVDPKPTVTETPPSSDPTEEGDDDFGGLEQQAYRRLSKRPSV